jgi:GH24 family phage-related lysozyme (muramidase)
MGQEPSTQCMCDNAFDPLSRQWSGTIITHFTNGDHWGTDCLSNTLKIAQLASGESRVQTQADQNTMMHKVSVQQMINRRGRGRALCGVEVHWQGGLVSSSYSSCCSVGKMSTWTWMMSWRNGQSAVEAHDRVTGTGGGQSCPLKRWLFSWTLGDVDRWAEGARMARERTGHHVSVLVEHVF